MQFSWRINLQTWLALLGLGVSLWLIIMYADLLLQVFWIVFGSFLLSLAISPAADALARWRVPRGLTVLGIYLGCLGLLAILGTLLVPVVSTEIALLRNNGPELFQKAITRLLAWPLLAQWTPPLGQVTQNLTQDVNTVLQALLNTVTGAGEIVVNFIIVLVLAYFLAADGTLGRRFLQNFAPISYQNRVWSVVGQLRFRLTRWIWAQIAIACFFALSFGLGATVLGVPFALTIALVGGVLEIIPYIGGFIALTLAVLSALSVNPWLALWVILLYSVIALAQGHIVAPAFYGRAMHLHPALVLVALLIGAKTGGIVGIFFAVPTTVMLMTLLHEWRTSSSLPAQPVPGTEPIKVEGLAASQEQGRPVS